MNVEEVVVQKCREGDILAADVINPEGIRLAVKDTQLNTYIKKRLIAFGIRNVRIYRKYERARKLSHEVFRDSYFDVVLQTKDMILDLAAGKPLDLEKVSLLTHQIKTNINGNDNIIKCLLELRSSDEYTFTHSVNVAFYCMLIAKWMDKTESEIEKVIQSGLLHDIGKSKISDAILNKGGILTKEEYEIIKQHAVFGYGMVREINDIDDDVKNAVLLHHERLDGTGYPFNSLSTSINLFTRIVAVADVFDAMTTDRVYKKRSTPFKAFEMFQTVGMSMFDTEIINIFINKMATHLVGSKVQFNNGQIGDIAYIPLHNVTCPIIKMASGYLDTAKEKEMIIETFI